MAEKHIMSAFDEDIEKIQSTLMKMGGLVEKSLFDAAAALVKSDCCTANFAVVYS